MLGNRIKEIRKGLGLTMKAFGNSLGLSESAISRIESGSANPSDGIVKLICSKYHVDYFWLTEGIGEPFLDDIDAIVDELAAEKGYDAKTVELVKRLFSLPEEQFNLVMQVIENLKDE